MNRNVLKFHATAWCPQFCLYSISGTKLLLFHHYVMQERQYQAVSSQVSLQAHGPVLPFDTSSYIMKSVLYIKQETDQVCCISSDGCHCALQGNQIVQPFH